MATERAIVGDGGALGRYLEHAEVVAQLQAVLKRERKPVRAAFVEFGIDYALARHAVWIRQTVDRHRQNHPELMNVGPSMVLLVHEAERRFTREGRQHELPALMADVVSGKPRSAVRAKHLPAKKAASDPVSQVVKLVRGGHLEDARRVLATLSVADGARLRDEYKLLRVTTNVLGLMCRQSLPGVTGSDAAASERRIRSAVGGMVSVEHGTSQATRGERTVGGSR